MCVAPCSVGVRVWCQGNPVLTGVLGSVAWMAQEAPPARSVLSQNSMPKFTATCPTRSGLVLDEMLASARTSDEHQPLAGHAALERAAPQELQMCCWGHTLCVLSCVGALLCWRQGFGVRGNPVHTGFLGSAAWMAQTAPAACLPCQCFMPLLTASCFSRAGLVLDDMLASARTSAKHQPLASMNHAALKRVAPQ
jgi:hypothetical protein